MLVLLILDSIDRHFAQILLSILLIYITWAPTKIKIKNPIQSQWASMLSGGFIGGAVSLSVGASGTFIAPLFLREEWSNKQVVATKAACLSILQILKIITYSTLGFSLIKYSYFILRKNLIFNILHKYHL